MLYEVFTGKKAFEAATLAEMIRLREAGPPASITSIVHDIDPGVEKVIAHCLDPEPRNRPSSALAISAALPGGDPLAAALAAGETPSPEMVAAAGASEGLQPAVAMACLAAIVMGLIVLVFCFEHEMYPGRMRLEIPPDALAVEAHKIVQQLGYITPPSDRTWGFQYSGDALHYLNSQKPAHPDWNTVANGRPSPVVFWYRESPRPLETNDFEEPGQVTLTDPPLRISGMVSVLLDPAGRLVYLEAVPPQVETLPAIEKPLDAAPLFTAAGLDMAQFKPAEPQWTPLAATDSRAAWTGIFPGRPENSIRVEAASWRGKPVYFEIIGPWTHPSRMQAKQASGSQRADQILWESLFGVLVVVGSLLAWRNLRLGRGDRQGAFRIAAAAFVLSMGVWIFGGRHVGWPAESGLFTNAVGTGLVAGVQLWIAYVALEPFGRRHWPKTIITWSRTLSGSLADPLVGRDILIGLLVGLGYDLVIAAAIAIDMRDGDAPGRSTSLLRASQLSAFCQRLYEPPARRSHRRTASVSGLFPAASAPAARMAGGHRICGDPFGARTGRRSSRRGYLYVRRDLCNPCGAPVALWPAGGARLHLCHRPADRAGLYPRLRGLVWNRIAADAAVGDGEIALGQVYFPFAHVRQIRRHDYAHDGTQ